MRNNTGKKQSIKPFLIALFLIGTLAVLIFYNELIPQYSLKMKNILTESYEFLISFTRDDSIPLPKTAWKTMPTPTPKPQSGRGSGDTLHILSWQAPTVLNPHLAIGAKDINVCRLTYEPLASFNKEGNLVPFLAAEIPSLENGGVAPDGKSVTWTLKQGVKWSDGEPFTAYDVLFTYQFITNPDTAASAVSVSNCSAIENIEVLDDYTVKINFTTTNPAWAVPFVGRWGMILPRHKFEAYNNVNSRAAPANTLPVGTGPYQVVAPGIKPQEVLLLGTQIVETNKIVYTPNPYFREADKPFFSKVELKGGGTVKEAARLVLQTGDVDYSNNLQLDAQTLAHMEAEGRGIVLSLPNPWIERIYLNLTDPRQLAATGERSSLEKPHPFFSDKRVRQAFSYAIDREAIVELYGKSGRLAVNLLASPSNYRSSNTVYEFNPEKAARLLDEAGWKDRDGDGIRDKDGEKMQVVFQTSVNPLRQETQKLIQKALQSIQVDVELDVIDSGTFFSNDPANPNTYTHFYADMQEYLEGNSLPDPGAYMRFYTCEQIPQKANDWSGENVSRWCNADYNALYEQSTTEMDPKKRAELFIQMNDMLVEDVVMIPLVDAAEVHGVGETLQGVDMTPWDATTWNIKDWRRRELP